MGKSDHGTTIEVYCDNMAAVSVFQSGRGKNKVILHAARAIWMVQAVFQVHLVFSHIPGLHNELADVLSRMSESTTIALKANQIVSALGLSWIQPSTDTLDTVYPLLLCSSACGGKGAGEATKRPGGLGRMRTGRRRCRLG